MLSAGKPSMNECAVAGRPPGPDGSTCACENDQTKPPAKLAVDHASQLGRKRRERTHRLGAEAPKAHERTHRLGAEAPKARERTHRGGEVRRKPRERSQQGRSGADPHPQESTKTENSPFSSHHTSLTTSHAIGWIRDVTAVPGTTNPPIYRKRRESPEVREE